MLAELGFSPRRVPVNGTLRPAGDDGAAVRRPEVAVVLDRDGDSGAICTRLRADEELGDVPIVVSIAAEELELGPEMLSVHELIVTPFTAGELSARIARARRAVHGVAEDDVARSDGLELNLATYQVTVDGMPVDFTYMEYELLKFLMTHPRRAFSRRRCSAACGAMTSSGMTHDEALGAEPGPYAERLVGALERLGARRAVAVRGLEGSDVMRPGRPVAFANGRQLELPELLGARLTGDGGAKQSAWLTSVVLRGEGDDLLSHTVALSAGVRLYAAGLASDPVAGAREARATLGDGRSSSALDSFLAS